jgi:hypothetical protein
MFTCSIWVEDSRAGSPPRPTSGEEAITATIARSTGWFGSRSSARHDSRAFDGQVEVGSPSLADPHNSAFDHAGNVAIAALAGTVGWMFSQRAVFLLVPVFAVLATAAALSIPASAVDQRRARGAREVAEGQRANDVASISVLLECRPLVIFGCCALIFHFANAPLLRAKARLRARGIGDGVDVVLHYCRAARDAADRPYGRLKLRIVGYCSRRCFVDIISSVYSE